MSNSADAALLDAVMNAAVDAIVMSDSTGRITRLNAAAEALFGHSAAEMLGQNVTFLMPPEYANQHDSYMHHHLETGERKIIGKGRPVSGLHKDGTVFPLHLSVGRAEVSGEVIFLGIMHDLTNRHATQAALERSQRLDAIGQMTGGISHDFNNLLTVVIGNLELLDMQITDARHRGLVRDALEAAEFGADLTANLMTFSRKSDLKPVVLNINDACKATLSLMKRSMGEGYKAQTRFEKDIANIQVDPAQLQSAFLNICMNAKDAMPEGGRILITTENIEIDDLYIAQEIDVDEGAYVRISISDTGIGMSPETQARALEPFYTTKPAGHGTGLGLAMVYGFVRQSGGHITIYSEPGQGTTISLYFPAVEEDATPKRSAPKAHESVAKTGNGQVVLVVEDNPNVRKLSVARVAELGYTALEASSGAQAYDILCERSDVAALFTDVVMPGPLNGFDLAKRVGAEFPQVKILITSGYSQDALSDENERSLGYDLLRKPYRQGELARRLQALLHPT